MSIATDNGQPFPIEFYTQDQSLNANQKDILKSHCYLSGRTISTMVIHALLSFTHKTNSLTLTKKTNRIPLLLI